VGRIVSPHGLGTAGDVYVVRATPEFQRLAGTQAQADGTFDVFVHLQRKNPGTTTSLDLQSPETRIEAFAVGSWSLALGGKCSWQGEAEVRSGEETVVEVELR
jgi:hypothetical protein